MNEQKKNEELEKLIEIFGNESFRQILNAIDEFVIIKGPKSRLLWANKAFCDYYGMTPEQLRGIVDAPFSEPDHTQKYVRDDETVFTTGKTLDIPQEPVTRYDGVIRQFHTRKSPIFDKNGNVVMIVGVSRDITDRLMAEQQVEDERARTLFSAKMASLGEMAGGIAHEINTPLAAIQLISSQIRDMVEENRIQPQVIASAARKIESTVTRIAKIVSGLKTFSRDSAKDPAQTVCLQKLIDETLSFCRERLYNHGIDLKLDLPKDDIFWEGSPTQLSQVILNLLNNAHDATASLAEKWIKISLKSVSGAIEIRVIDSGKGIPASVRPKLFTPFFSTKEIGKGTGIGLSISQSIVESYKGTLDVDYRSPNTAFVIRLPVKG